MATLTLHDIPEDLYEQLREAAQRHGRSVEEEVTEALAERYQRRAKILDRARERWSNMDAPSADQVDSWIDTGRE